MRRHLIVVLLFFLCAPYAGAQDAAPESKPNIVVMMVDNYGSGELGCYGGGVLRGAETPRLDQLAAEGLPHPDCEW